MNTHVPRLSTWKRFKRLPWIARISWRVYLFRDFWSTKVWKKTQESLTPFGFKLRTRNHPAYALMRSGEFEREEVKIFQALMSSAEVFIDVGANLGYYCCLALQRGKAVIAFEPQVQNLELLFANLQSNGWRDLAEVIPIALSEKPGLLELYGASGPSASLVKDWAGYSPRFAQTVAVNTLDNIIGGRFVDRQIVVKIDVEGAEYHVLRGALQTISRAPRPAWLMEICFREYHPDGVNPDFADTFELFWKQGYACFCADGSGTQIRRDDIKRWLETGKRDVNTFNYVFVDEDSPLKRLVHDQSIR